MSDVNNFEEVKVPQEPKAQDPAKEVPAPAVPTVTVEAPDETLTAKVQSLHLTPIKAQESDEPKSATAGAEKPKTEVKPKNSAQSPGAKNGTASEVPEPVGTEQPKPGQVALVTLSTQFLMTPTSPSVLSDEEKAAAPLFFCHYCFKTGRTHEAILNHLSNQCTREHPGNVVYDYENILMLEVDPTKHLAYCKNLAHFGNLFLGQRKYTAAERVQNTLFYVLIKREGDTNLAVAFFTKDVVDNRRHVMQRIAVFPPWQMKGHCRLILEIAHQMAVTQKMIGYVKYAWTPEFIQSYFSFVKYSVVKYFLNRPGNTYHRGKNTLEKFQEHTGIHPLHVRNFFSFKQWLVSRDDGDEFTVFIDKCYLDAVQAKMRESGRLIEYHAEGFKWVPTEHSPINASFVTIYDLPSVIHLISTPQKDSYTVQAESLGIHIGQVMEDAENDAVDLNGLRREDGQVLFEQYLMN